MAIRKFQKITISGESPTKAETNRIQDSISATLNPITVKTWEDTSILSNITLLAGQTNVVPHLLNRVPYGHKIILQSAEGTIYDVESPDNLFFYIRSSANMTVSLEVS